MAAPLLVREDLGIRIDLGASRSEVALRGTKQRIALADGTRVPAKLMTVMGPTWLQGSLGAGPAYLGLLVCVVLTATLAEWPL